MSPAEVVSVYRPRLRHGPLWAFNFGRELARGAGGEDERLTAEDLVAETWPGDPTALRCFSAGWIEGLKEQVAA
jgi:hypothetical protein